MLVATSVATDTRVLREASTLVGAGHEVHIIGRSVPTDFVPPDGITVSSIGTSSVLRKEGGATLKGKVLPPHLKFARWVLLPTHRTSAFGRWARGAVADGRTRAYDVVHAHDFTALEAGAELADLAGVPLVYDTHELWCGRPREHRPTPLTNRRERIVEGRLGRKAQAVITVGDGVAAALRARYGWDHVTVVRNTFPQVPVGERRQGLEAPVGLVYAGRLGAYRELETIAAASDDIDLPITLMGPADETWLGSFDRHATRVRAAEAPEDVDAVLAAAGLVLVTHSDQWENHRLAMPNKLFHAIHAGVPVVATDVGELAKIVRAYRVGTLYPPGDATGLVRAVREAVASYPALRDAVRDATAAMSWEADAAALRGIYDRLEASRGGSHR